MYLPYDRVINLLQPIIVYVFLNENTIFNKMVTKDFEKIRLITVNTFILCYTIYVSTFILGGIAI